jgi:tRNA G10  N-methylase Trm11
MDALATNLPWGRQVGRARELPGLYGGVLAEAARVVRPGGRLVFLTSESDALRGALKDLPELKPVRVVGGVEVLGRRADIIVLERLP